MYQSSIYINTVYVENSDAAGCFVWTTSTNVGGVIDNYAIWSATFSH